MGHGLNVGDVGFNDLHWTSVDMLARATPENTRQQHLVFPTTLLWQFVPIHELAAQLPAGQYGLSNRVFSQIGFEQNQQDNMSTYINRMLNSLSGSSSAQQLSPKLCSHSIRRGAQVVAAACANL